MEGINQNIKTMKTAKINNQKVKVSKKFITEILKLDRAVSHYTRYDDEPLAYAIASAWPTFVDANDSLSSKVEYIYNNIDKIIKAYENYY